MAHPSQILKDSAPHKIVIVDENSNATFTGNFFAYTCLNTPTDGACTVKGRSIFEKTASNTYTETASSSAVTIRDVVGVTIFGDFTEFTPANDSSARYILYVSVEDQ